MSEQKIEEPRTPMTLAEFLESSPPATLAVISDLISMEWRGGAHWYFIAAPELHLHCGNERCNGMRVFRAVQPPRSKDVPTSDYQFLFVDYCCSNCAATTKTFSLAVKRDGDGPAGHAYKFGELPNFGPPTPARLLKLIGPDRELFLRGRRCENQGLGIGAFVYYRRVIEGQKNRIIDEILKVSQKIGAPPEVLAALEAAKAETQFSKAIDTIKPAVPQALLVNGHNPLTLLHSALSEGLHQQSDEVCLELATSVRVVLAELSERLAQALKDEAELNKAISRLMQAKG